MGKWSRSHFLTGAARATQCVAPSSPPNPLSIAWRGGVRRTPGKGFRTNPVARLRVYGWLLALLLVLAVPVMAQEDGDDGIDAEVYVTTQDYSSLRAGPSIYFERLATVPPAITLPAIGRSADARWVQVVYDGQMGWVAYWLLVWSGNLIELPVDGVNPLPFVRRTLVEAVTTRETPIYLEEVDPSTQVGVLPENTEVELVGRLGERGFFQIQILYQGQLYWVGSWNLRITNGNYHRLLDATYRFPAARLIAQLTRDIQTGAGRLGQIENIWGALQSGRSVACAPIPAYLGAHSASQSDLELEPLFAPLVVALDAAIAHTNTAISLFEDACNRGETYITQTEVQNALEEINSAYRNWNVAMSLLASLRLRGLDQGQ